MLPAQSQDFGTPNPVPLANPYPSGLIPPLIRSLISSSENSIACAESSGETALGNPFRNS
jgi:hypothetical protein